MVNSVHGNGHGHAARFVSPTPQVTNSEETAEATPTHPGKGKAGAPGQLAKEMLGGTRPPGFALGNLVSLIAHGDLEGAQSLAASVTAPPPSEDPAPSPDGVDESVIGDIASPDETTEETSDAAPLETAATTEETPSEEEAGEALAAPTTENDPVNSDAEIALAGLQETSEDSLVDLFSSSEEDTNPV
ncbi:hypothetical protein [Sneathiella limimaris]|uniref:hypothetical protein n=1 Tax=Sneathiella limimaris TaxID=1964213 RepID=UPI00146CE52E|nr:hypothetical protein [Sneathiella limimaris]